MSLLGSPFFFSSGATSSGFYPFEPTGSLRFDSSKTSSLSRTNASAGDRRTWTFSAWVKRAELGSGTQNYIFGATTDNYNVNWAIFFFGSDEITFYSYTSSQQYQINTTGVFRDPSSWYHVVLAWDTTQATAADRIKLYVNGLQIEEFDTAVYPSQNYQEGYINNNIQQDIGRAATAAYGYDGYMSEIYFIDGSALAPASFGEFKSGIWMPKDAKSSLTFGTNGFYLPFNTNVTATGQSTVLYRGTSTPRAVEGFGYKPDFVWYKNRDDTYSHILHDRVRGPSSYLISNQTAVEGQAGGTIQAFTNQGFYAGTNSSTNYTGNDIVAWAWDAGADQTATGFGCVIYTGDATDNGRPVADVGFRPGLVWIKNRDVADGHVLYDSVRGPGRALASHSNAAEDNTYIMQNSFDKDGFSVGDAGGDNTNENAQNYVAWCWDAGDSPAVSNSTGSIASTVQASTANGFSIVTYTGSGSTATVGHGLSSAPDFILVKSRSNSRNWRVYNSISGATKYLGLNKTDAIADSDTFWNDTEPTSSVFTVNTATTVNGSSENYVAYCWHSVSGYSKIGSYTGTGSSGNAVTGLGFRPAWIIVKRLNSTSDWTIFDNQRDPFYDGTNNRLWANLNSVESTTANYMEFTSDGFTLKAGDAAINASGSTYLYMAFAGGKDTIAPINTNGSITSRVKASNETGFSIVEYEGTGANATIGHGLSSAPDWMLIKNRSLASNWIVYHSSITTNFLELNTTDVQASNSVIWSSQPTSSVFSVGSGNPVNRSGDKFIAYCWTATSGKSAFGSYTGTGSSGKSITGLGFKPSFLMIRSYDETRNWIMVDSKRGGSLHLNANATSIDSTGEEVRFDSDGFTLLSGAADSNYSSFNYIYMAFADGQSSSFFGDESGNSNDFNPTGIQNYDVVSDNSVNNFPTLNELANNQTATLSEGNLKMVTPTSNYGMRFSTIQIPTSGKWYWEAHLQAVNTIAPILGVSAYDSQGTYFFAEGSRVGLGYYGATGYLYGNQDTSGSSYGATYTAGDIISLAVNVDDSEVTFYKNGVSQGADSFDAAGLFAAFGDYSNSNNCTWIVNFGQDGSFAGTKPAQGYTDENGIGEFFYSVPSGFLSLSTKNLPSPSIDPSLGDTPDEHFNTKLFTGNRSTQSITGVGFQPEWLWIKRRDSGPTEHGLFDSVRGAGKSLKTNNTTAEQTQTDSVTSFDSDGFSLGANGQAGPDVNYGTSGSYVSWNWLAGGTSPSKTYTVKVVSDSGNKYRFDDFGTSAVTLNLQEGGTYTFDQSDSSNSGHPLRFYTAADKSGGEYTTGVTTNGTPGSSGAYTRITVAASAPTLYYQCSVHAGMGGQANTNSTHGSSNFDGTIQSTISTNLKGAFSIITYTGIGSAGTIGHGLNSAPEMVIVKNLSTAVHSPAWPVWHTGLIDGGYYLDLQTTAVQSDGGAAVWNDTAPTSSVFSVGTTSSCNNNGDNFVAYCFHSVEGYSKFGTYIGNGFADGTFVYTGFKPSFVMIKVVSTTSDWIMFDNKRDVDNEITKFLYPDLSNAEATGAGVLDFLSNGFKLRGTATNRNASGEGYIYWAISEQPFKFANAR